MRIALVSKFHCTLHFSFVIRCAEGLAFVVGVFTLTKGYLHLRKTTFIDEEAEWDNCFTRVFDLFFQFAQLLLGHQQFAVALDLVIGVTTKSVLSNMHLLDPQLIAYELTICIHQRSFVLANGLNLRAIQLNTSDIAIQYLVVKRGTAILNIYVTFQAHISHGYIIRRKSTKKFAYMQFF